jgi:hypothetical protein
METRAGVTLVARSAFVPTDSTSAFSITESALFSNPLNPRIRIALTTFLLALEIITSQHPAFVTTTPQRVRIDIEAVRQEDSHRKNQEKLRLVRIVKFSILTFVIRYINLNIGAGTTRELLRGAGVGRSRKPGRRCNLG